MEIELKPHWADEAKGIEFDQWLLYVDGQHLGLVQKSSGMIQLNERVGDAKMKIIGEKVGEKLSKPDLPIGQPMELPVEEDDEDEY